MSNIQELSEDGNLEDDSTELEHGPFHDTKYVEKMINKNVTIVLTENRQDKNLMTRIYFNAAVEAQT